MGHDGNIVGLWRSLASDAVTVDERRCVVVRNRHASCRACADVCPTGCIEVDEGRLRVHRERCVGCGSCATACLSGALRAAAPSDDELEQRGLTALDAEGALTVTCGRIPSPAGVSVRCLGRVHEGLLAAWAAAGARTIVLRHGPCSTCPLGRGGAVAEEVGETMNALSRAWGRPSLVTWEEAPVPEVSEKRSSAPQAPSEESPLRPSRPKIDGDAAEEREGPARTDPPAPSLPKVGRDGTLPSVVPQRREALLRLVRSWGDPVDSAAVPRLWGAVSIDGDRCRSCRMCAVFCPTGALARSAEDDDFFGLLHRPALCLQCQTCQSVCPAGALTVSDEVSPEDVVGDAVCRIPLTPPPYQRVGPHSATDAMQAILGTRAIYEK